MTVRPEDAPAGMSDTDASSQNGVAGAYRRFARGLGDVMPKGLYARSLLIILMPVVLLQAFVAFVFMERH
jgi:two-component system osmolarity sensor histidine kinase EnvZ